MIKWKLPTPDEPGYLKRKIEIEQLLEEDNTKKVVEYLAQFVDAERKEAIKQILEAPQNEFFRAILHLRGYTYNPDSKKGEKSE